MKDILKWGLVVVVGYLALKWIVAQVSDFAESGASTVGGLQNAPYSAPLVGPQPVYAWSPWQLYGNGEPVQDWQLYYNSRYGRRGRPGRW